MRISFRLFQWAIPLFAGLIASAIIAGEPSAAVMSAYRQRWADREDAALTTAARVQLARNLLAEAQQTDEPEMKLLLCERVYEWSRRDCPEGLATADAAIQMIQQLDPSRRLDCLIKLSGFYEQAWRESRLTDYRYGVQLAITSMEKAHQRLLDTVKQRDAGKMTDVAMLQQLDQCRRDYGAAFVAISRAVNLAGQSAPEDDDAQARQKFATELASCRALVSRIEHGQVELDHLYKSAREQGEQALAAFRPEHVEQAPPVPPVSTASAERHEDRPTPPAPTTTARKPVERSAKHVAVATNSLLHMVKCAKCGEMFVPEPGSNETLCYWCRRGKRLFDLGKFAN